ncbi:hypothetical protein PRIPAC_75846 [Pristionchus pacificus]|uniref:CPG4 domain-containing protein n=1 Tax=Pristionchus pacificus TaxID=54126 RepID=A0A2A6C105_PRIPA|nr:hypothetical protein PRIPAC_75846 [Pristionchus pacificus]|eukprot:PDM71799.1 hypothetical protein PRIPAC_38206 [Pristionchus pacificus]
MHRGLPLGLLLLLAATGRSADFALTLPAKGAAPGADLVYNKEFMSGILQAFMSPKGVNATRLLEAFNPTPCLQKCMPTLSKFLDSLDTKHSLRDTKDTVALCRQLESIEECAATTHCDSTLLDLATKTYKFACVDKIESLGDSLKCAQDAFSTARVDCETGCIVDRTNHVDPSKLPVDVESLCESSVCLLGCMQKSINAACLSRGNTPSLFNAILTTTSGDDRTLSSVFAGILPMECRDVLKAQANLPEQIAQLAGLGKDSPPMSVGKPRAPATTTSTTTTTATPSSTTTTRPSSTTTPSNAMLWQPEWVEAPIDVDGEARTLQCRVLDWERRPVASPSVDRLARLIAQQLLKQDDMQMRAADDGDADSTGTAEDWAFRRWMSSHDAANYRDLGFGADTRREGVPIPQLRSNSDDQPSSYPSWSNLAMAGIFPFVIYLVD